MKLKDLCNTSQSSDKKLLQNNKSDNDQVMAYEQSIVSYRI